jgi:sugar (pentulose or hexulose) kinase
MDGGMWLGFDLGTQSIRAMAVSETGHVLGQSSQPLTSRRDGPRHEQDPEHWWRATVTACRSLLADLPNQPIRGLAVDGTSGTIVLIDRSGNPLTPGLMYDDARAAGEAQHVDEVGAPLWAALGYRMQPTWALPKLLWLLREHHHVIFQARLAHQADFINRRLAGCEVASDTSNALKTGYDLICERWPLDVLEALELPEHLLPPVVRPGTIVGAVCAEAAVQTGIPAGTPIVAGMTDGCAAQISAGALQVGSWNSVLGTTLVLKGVSDSLIRDTAGVVYSHRSPDGNWLPGGASNTGAAVLAQWFPGKDLDALSVLATERGPVRIIAYPLVSRGERFPFVAPDAEGFVLGDVTELDLFAALLQGVSFIERLCFDYLELLGAPIGGDVSLTGGGARNRHWRQLRADVLGRSVRLPENTEPAFGMAVLAASPGRRISDVAQNMVRIREVIDPRSDHSARLHELYLQLVDELVRRGWLETRVAEHARRRVG